MEVSSFVRSIYLAIFFLKMRRDPSHHAVLTAKMIRELEEDQAEAD